MFIGSKIEIKENQVFKWKVNLNEKQFDCDPLLPPFLGFYKQKKMSIAQLFSRFDRRQTVEVTKAFKNVLESQANFERIVVVDTPNGRCLVKLSFHPLENQKNSVEGELCYLQLFPSEQQENELLRKVFNNSDDGRMITSSGHIIIMVNENFCDETGYKEHELIGQSARIFKSGQYESAFYKNLWDTVDTTKTWKGELLGTTKQQEVYTREVQMKRIDFDENSHFYLSKSNKIDVPSSLIHSQVIGDSEHSNLPEKVVYTKALEDSFKKIGSDQTIVVAAFSINWLQKMSEFTAAWLISQRFNQLKQVGTIGVISNGIYSIYWVEEKNPDKIDTLLRQLLTAFSYGFDDADLDLFSTINIGVSILSVDAKNPTQLISHSIQTLIANPAKVQSSLYYYDRRLAKRFDRHHVLAKLLKKALNEKSVEVYYQPIVAIPSMEVEEFEALFRIKLETELEYDTQELINIAETYNWIDEIDAMVTKISLQALPKLQKHYGNENISMAINRSLKSDKITRCCLEDTINILLGSGADLSKVTIELTESAIFENFEQQKQWVEKLQTHGVKIAIDDFGTGYSSFAYLNNLPVDYIKIDRSFVTGVTLDSNEYAMIEMLCKLAHKIGAQVIAEGVETEEEFRLLSQAKVDLLQGYIFNKPISLANILAEVPAIYSEKFTDYLYQKPIVNISNIYMKEFKSAEFDDRLADIKDELIVEDHTYFIVLEGKKCCGVLYTNDYYAAVSPHIDTESEQKRDTVSLDKRIHQIMQKNIMILQLDSDIKLAEEYFEANPYRIIAVTNKLGECVGIVTVQGLFRYQQGLPIEPKEIPVEVEDFVGVEDSVEVEEPATVEGSDE